MDESFLQEAWDCARYLCEDAAVKAENEDY